MAEKALDVAVVGNVGVDTNVYLAGDRVDWSVEGHFTENLDCLGQAGGYSSRGFAQLAWRTAFIGYVGDDPLGRFVREELAGDGIDLSALFIDPAGTSRSINFMDREGRRRNFYDGKGHMTLTPDLDACTRVLTQARLAHFHLPNWARHLLPIARQLGLVISCDLQDLSSVEDPYRQDFIRYADVLFFSAANVGTPEPEIEALLRKKPALTVIAGLGARGCALGTMEGIRRFDPVSLPEPVVDTNGAGDGLAVGFLSSRILDGLTLEAAVRRGQIAARHTCALKATSSRLITRDELDLWDRRLAAGG